MPNLPALGKILLGTGLILILIGLVLMYGQKIVPLGRLPGDIYLRKGNFTFFFPLASGIVISIVLTVLLNLLLRR